MVTVKGRKNRGTKNKSQKNKYIYNSTLKSLQKLSYKDLKNLSSEELQKYKKELVL